jgi:nucleotide-binding universal stress UspA family protein
MKTEPLEPLEPVESTHPFTPATSQEKVVKFIPSVLQIKSILVPLDFSEMSLKSLRYAVPFAKQFGAKLTLVHVVEAPVNAADSSFPALVSRDRFAEIEQKLEDMIPPELSVDTTVRQSIPFDGILEVAQEINADLIITTTHGYTGLAQLFKGATVSNIVNRSPCPVLVVRENEHGFV